jgi:hypothetical protein
MIFLARYLFPFNIARRFEYCNGSFSVMEKTPVSVAEHLFFVPHPKAGIYRCE